MPFDFSKLPVLDWNDIVEVNQICANILAELARPEVLRELFENTEQNPELFNLCETHELDDKIVLYNNISKGYRIRLRLANDEQYERAHNHRFSFTTLILRGAYYQRWYVIDGIPGDATTTEQVSPVCVREEPTGTIFTIDHQTIHSTLTSKNTISLVICGPPMKDKAFIIRMDDGKVWYKMGQHLETEEQKKATKMSRERFEFWKKKLEDFNLI